MKYLCLVYSEEKNLESVPDEECLAYDATLRQSGHCVASEALQPVETATTVASATASCPSPMVRSPRRRSSWPGSTSSTPAI